MRLHPLHDRIVVTRVAVEEKSAGGILIPDTAKEKPQRGIVVSVGPGVRDTRGAIHNPDVECGDLVLFGKWSGSEVKLDGTDYTILREDDVFGVLTEAHSEA